MRWLVGLSLLITLAGCDTAPPDGLRIGMPTAPLTLDPRFATDAAAERIGRLLFSRLTDHDEHGRAIPALATWQMISPRVYDLHLRPDRPDFSDGKPITGEDVVATYRALLDPAIGSPHRQTLSGIAGINALDGDTVRFTLSTPDVLFPGKLTPGILPARQAALPERLEQPVASGNFTLVGRSDTGVVLRRRRDDLKVSFLRVAEPTVRVLKLVRGELDLVQNDLPPEQVAWLGEQGGITVQKRPGDSFTYLGFNLRDALTGQLGIRQAIAHAIDRQAIIRYLFHGRAAPAEAVLPPAHWARETDLEPVSYDPAQARRLLAKAGFDAQHPLRLVYKTSADPFRLRLATAIQAQLATVGIRLKIESHDWGTFYGDIKAGRFQLYSLSWVGIKEPDMLRHIYHSASMPPHGANRGGYHSPAVDDALDRALNATDMAGAARAFRRAQQLIHADQVYVPLWREYQTVATSPRVHGYTLRSDGAYDGLNQVTLTEAPASGD